MDSRKPIIHTLKIWPEFYKAVIEGHKRYEIRETADRNFAVGDYLILQEFDPDTRDYSGEMHTVEVLYITDGGNWGIPIDLCIMSIKSLFEEDNNA